MKIKIDLEGWNSFNGKLGGVQFENGISARDVTDKEARRIGANVRVINIDTNEQLGITTINNGDVEAKPLKMADTTPDPIVEKIVEDVKEVVEVKTKKAYTKEELEEIADKEGISGIRKIALKFDVKGVQIAQLINDILVKQGN